MLSEFETFWKNVSRGGNTKPGATLGECVTHMGTIGWADEDEHVFPGTDANDGFTLVRVTLYEGRSFNDASDPSVAQGHQILCNVGSGVYRMPAKGTRCFVIIPKGLEQQPGAGVITQTVERSPSEQFAENRITTDYGPDHDYVIQAGVARIILKPSEGSVSILTTDSNTRDGKVVGITLSPNGFKFTSPSGSFVFDATGFHLKTLAGPRLDMGGMVVPGIGAIPGIGAVVGAFTGYANLTAPTVKINGSQVYLGAGAVFNPAVYALSTPPPPDVPNPSGTALPPGQGRLGGSVWVSL